MDVTVRRVTCACWAATWRSRACGVEREGRRTRLKATQRATSTSDDDTGKRRDGGWMRNVPAARTSRLFSSGETWLGAMEFARAGDPRGAEKAWRVSQNGNQKERSTLCPVWGIKYCRSSRYSTGLVARTASKIQDGNIPRSCYCCEHETPPHARCRVFIRVAR